MKVRGAAVVGIDETRVFLDHAGKREFLDLIDRRAPVARPVASPAVVSGFRLLGVKADGPLGTLDLQNGDVVHAINGLEMTSPDGALQAYTKLKSANHLSVALERNGRRITNDYDIR